MVEGNSTPLNEAPIRWWGGRRGWVNDWDSVVQQFQVSNPHTAHGELGGAMGTGSAQPEYWNTLAFRDRYERGGVGPGAFLDEEIRASFDGVKAVGDGFADPLTPSLVRAPMGANVGYEMEGIPVPRAVPMPMALETKSRIQNDIFGYGEVDLGPPPVETGSVINLTRRHSYRVNLPGNANRFIPDGAVSACLVLVALVDPDYLPIRRPYKIK